ncbi:MAG TPA: branched-chain amino acid ABC transporter permease [Symbiobacteriaceae bacterium]|jgi:branched-chain amino acid transport system permease protein
MPFRNRSVVLGGVGLAVLLAIPLVVTQPHPQHVLIMIFLYALMGIAWNLVGGYAGQVSFGHAVFFGTGAYTTTLLMTKAKISPIIGMFAGGVVAAGIALIIGWGCFRLAGHYFAIATFTVGQMVQIIATQWKYIGAAVGVYVPLDRQYQWWLTLQFKSKAGFYYVALLLLGAGLWLCWQIGRNRLGAYFRAIKGDPEAARSLGIDIFRQKLYALMISAFVMAVVGGVFAQYVLFIDPASVFDGALSIKVALVAVLGGAGSLWGPVLGAAVLIPLNEYTSVMLGSSGSGLDLLLYGVLIVVVSVYQPDGLAGLWDRLFGARGRILREKKVTADAAARS